MKKVFIAGPREVKKLDNKVLVKLKAIKDKGYTVYVGDANGVDKLVQEFYKGLSYKNLEVFASNGRARNNLGAWKVNNIKVDKSIKNFNFYAEKDKAMARKAEYGFMIWNGKSRGTLNNMINLRKENKNILLYFMPLKEFYYIETNGALLKIVNSCDEDTKKLYLNLLDGLAKQSKQISMEIKYL